MPLNLSPAKCQTVRSLLRSPISSSEACFHGDRRGPALLWVLGVLASVLSFIAASGKLLICTLPLLAPG